MTHDLINKLEETFSDLANLTPAKMQELVQETLKAFTSLQQQFASNEPEAQEEAARIANELKGAFETQAEKLYQSIGMSREDLGAFMEDPSNFSQTEWETVSGLANDIQQLKSVGQKEEKAASKKNKRSKMIRIAG